MPGLLAIAALSILVALVCAQNLSAPPWIRKGGVVNAASHLPASVPGGALAPVKFVPPTACASTPSGHGGNRERR